MRKVGQKGRQASSWGSSTKLLAKLWTQRKSSWRKLKVLLSEHTEDERALCFTVDVKEVLASGQKVSLASALPEDNT